MQQTIKKLSLEAADEEGFQTLSFERAEVAETVLTSPQVLNPRMGAFAYPRSTWDSLMSDPSSRLEWERLVEERLATRLASEHEGYRAGIRQSAREEGVREGLAIAQAAVEGSREKMNAICREIVAKQETILRSHERAWADALANLLKRFLIPNPDALAAGLRGWLQESLEGFPAKGQLRVRVAAADYDAIFESLAAGDGWELVRDESLVPGEVHAETDAGGIFFSPSKEAEKLENLIAEFFPQGRGANHA